MEYHWNGLKRNCFDNTNDPIIKDRNDGDGDGDGDGDDSYNDNSDDNINYNDDHNENDNNLPILGYAEPLKCKNGSTIILRILGHVNCGFFDLSCKAIHQMNIRNVQK